MGTRGRGIAVVVIGTLTILGAPRAFASGFTPQNDDLATANDITNGGADFGPMLGATHEAGEPLDTASDTGSVWEKWTAPSNATVTASMCDPNNLSGGPFDSILDVYSGPTTNPTYGLLNHVAFNDDGCGSSNHLSAVKWAAFAGTTYYIRVDQDATTAGNYVIQIDVAPPNDDFAGTSIGGAPLSIAGSNVGATKEAGEPDIAGQPGGASVWWSWTAPATGTYAIQTCNSSFNTLLAVYTGSAFSGGGLTLVTSNDNGCGLQSSVTLSATANTVYRITVDGGPGISNVPETGTIELDIASAPTNDLLADATSITGFPTAVTASTLLASAEASEPAHGTVAAAHSIWYRWTAPTGGPVTIDTCGSSVDTTLSVYSDGASFPLTSLAENNDSCGSQSRVTVPTTSGTAYVIAIDGVEGVVQLHIHDITPPTVHIDSAVIKQAKHRASFTFSGSDDRGGVVTFECKIDAQSFGACPVPTVYRHLHPGTHTFSVRGTDAAGNRTTASRSFRIRR